VAVNVNAILQTTSSNYNAIGPDIISVGQYLSHVVLDVALTTKWAESGTSSRLASCRTTPVSLSDQQHHDRMRLLIMERGWSKLDDSNNKKNFK